jgi:surface protein
MSVGFTTINGTTTIGVPQKTYPSLPNLTRSYVRNPTWPVVSAPYGSEQVVGLYAVFPTDNNFFSFTGAVLQGGDYRINFGDGTTIDYVNGTLASYLYDYSAAALVGTDGPVTFTDSTDTVNRTSHGYTNGMTVQFYNIVSTTGITTAQTYNVINATDNTFQISLTPTGSAVALTTNGSGTLLPYRIATVTITPAVSGQTLTTVNITQRYAGLTTSYVSGWLSLHIACSASNLSLSNTLQQYTHRNLVELYVNQVGNVANFQRLCFNMYSLQLVQISNAPNTLVNTANMFQNCYSLKVVSNFNTSQVANMESMFSNCKLLTSVPQFDTSLCSNFTSMFSGCNSLTEVPLFNMAAASINITSMFQSCSALTTLPTFNFSNVVIASNLCNSCGALTYVPTLNFTSVTTLATAFSNCNSLIIIEGINTSSALTSTANMFNGCNSLVNAPFFNTSAVSLMNGMFGNCYSLVTVPLYNTGAVTNMSSMFFSCFGLLKVPTFNTASVTNFQSIFSNTTALKEIPALSVAGTTSSSAYSAAFNLPTLGRMLMAPKFTFTVANCQLSGTALNEMYTNLPTVTGQTVTVTGNFGTATDNPAIATAKGWAVTG